MIYFLSLCRLICSAYILPVLRGAKLRKVLRLEFLVPSIIKRKEPNLS